MTTHGSAVVFNLWQDVFHIVGRRKAAGQVRKPDPEGAVRILVHHGIKILHHITSLRSGSLPTRHPCDASCSAQRQVPNRMRHDHRAAIPAELVMRTLGGHQHETIREQPFDNFPAVSLHAHLYAHRQWRCQSKMRNIMRISLGSSPNPADRRPSLRRDVRRVHRAGGRMWRSPWPRGRACD